jgi:hypothetical protein
VMRVTLKRSAVMRKWAMAGLALAPPWAMLMLLGTGAYAETSVYSLAMLHGQSEQALVALHRPLSVGDRECHVIHERTRMGGSVDCANTSEAVASVPHSSSLSAPGFAQRAGAKLRE